MGKKKFIDRKKSVTFQLLARDSSDPNYDGTPGSDRVFVRVDNNPHSADNFFADKIPVDDRKSIFADAPDDIDDGGDSCDRIFGNSANSRGGERFGGDSAADSAPLPEHVRREILELGFPDDGYNYLLHLREIGNTGVGSAFFHNPKFRADQLLRDVKAYDASRVRVSEVKSEDKNDKSIYSVASKTVGVGIQKVVDPEVAALLDDCDLSRFGSDVEDLEEDFVVRANVLEGGSELDTDKKFDLIDESNECVTFGHQENAVEHHGVGLDKVVHSRFEARDDFSGEKPRIRRPLDEQFDLLEHQEYGLEDEDDGYDAYIAEEDESLAEKLKHSLNDCAVDGELDGKYEVPADLLHGNEKPKSKELLDLATGVIRYCRDYAQKYENEDEDVIVEQESSDESEEWDCETIITTYSNLDNHPAKIEVPLTARKKKLAETVSGAFNDTDHVISLRGKEKLPVDFLSHRKSVTEKAKGVPGLKTEQQKRKQHGQESKEEKKERKAAVKEERREARRLKKEMKGLYRCEAQLAQKAVAVAGPSSIRLM